MPKVSIILPVFNGEAFLQESIESVLRQTFSDFELIIIDDGSFDRSADITQSFATNDHRIRLIRNERNLGLQRTLNRGIKESRGQYIARIDSDDIWNDTEKIDKQVRFLENYPDCAVVGTFAETIDAHGDKTGFIRYATTDADIRKRLLITNQFAHPSVLIRKTALDALGPYSEKPRHRKIEDYELWLRLGTRFYLGNIPDECLTYRIHTESMSMQGSLRQHFGGLLLSLEYASRYPGAFKAIAIKLATLVIPRFFLDTILRHSPLAQKTYARLTGGAKH